MQRRGEAGSADAGVRSDLLAIVEETDGDAIRARVGAALIC